MIGFLVYNIIIQNLINTETIIKKTYKPLFDDLFKFGTMFIIFKLLISENIEIFLNDTIWLKETLYKLFGLFLFNIIILKFIKTDKLKPKMKLVIEDIFRFSIMYSLVEMYNNKEDKFNKFWIQKIALEICGYCIYNALYG